MKKIRYTLLASCLFALCGCGTTDVWKDWEDQGTMNEETRLRPSEVKKLLCAADGWKLSYEGVDFYLQFDENGNVITNTNEKIPPRLQGRTDRAADLGRKHLAAIPQEQPGIHIPYQQLCLRPHCSHRTGPRTHHEPLARHHGRPCREP